MSDQNPIKRILYATNLGPHMRPVFRYALNLARIHKAKIIMLHAVSPLGATGEALLSIYLSEQKIKEIEEEDFEDVISTMKVRLENYCSDNEDLCKDSDELIERVVVGAGKPSEVIEKYADGLNADLIVIGSHTHTRKSPMGFLGTTARQVTQHSKVPVLVFPNSIR